MDSKEKRRPGSRRRAKAAGSDEAGPQPAGEPKGEEAARLRLTGHIVGARVSVQLTSARTPEEHAQIVELALLLDYFLEQVPGFVEDREATLAAIRPVQTPEDQDRNHELVTGFLERWNVPYVGGKGQDPHMVLAAPYRNAPFLSGSRDCVIVRSFESPFLSVDIDLSYTQTTIFEVLKEHVKRHQGPLREQGLNRTLKERVDRLRDARTLREAQLKGKDHRAIAEAEHWSIDKALWVERELKRLMTKDGVEEEGRQVSARVMLAKRIALRDARASSDPPQTSR